MKIFDVSMNPERVPFPEVLRALVKLARDARVDLLLVGATARDIALAAERAAAPLRATNDVDIAVAVADQKSFDALVASLTPAKSGNLHKFLVEGVEVDIVPFGGIEREDRTIEWPDGTQMNTLGFAEALGCSFDLRLDDDVTISVASLPAQAALKIFAWTDRGHWTDRDAVDFRTLMHAYGAGQRLDAIYAERQYGLLERYDYEVRPVGAHLLGTDVRDNLGEVVAMRCADVINDDLRGPQRLGVAMRGEIEENLLLLDAFVAGAQPPDLPPSSQLG